MDILGIGFSELVLIFIIALMVLGPRRLPEYAAKAGKIVRDLRNMSQGFLTEWRREIMVATRIDELEETRRELQEAKLLLQETRNNVASETNQIASETSQAITETKRAASEAAKVPEETSPAAGPPSATPPSPEDTPASEEVERTIKLPQTVPTSEPPAVVSQKVVNE